MVLILCSTLGNPTVLPAGPPPPLPLLGLIYSPDGRRLAVAGGGLTTPGELSIWDVAQQKLLCSRAEPQGVLAVAFSPDGSFVAIGGVDQSLKLLDAATGELKQVMNRHAGPVRAVAFSPDGRTLASGSYDKTVRLWDLSTGDLRRTLAGHTDRIFAVKYSSDGALLASASADRHANVWDAESGELIGSLDHGEFPVYGLDFSIDGRWLATASGDSAARLWDMRSGSVWMAVDGRGGLSGVVFGHDNAALFLWNNEGRTIKRHVMNTNEANPAQRQEISELITGLNDDSIEVREASGEKLLRFGMLAAPALGEATKSTSAEVRIRARRLRRIVRYPVAEEFLVPGLKSIARVALSPDGRHAAVGSDASVIELWDIERKAKVAALLK